MPAQANANVVALQLEKVRDKVPLLYERDDVLLTMIQQRGDVEKVSSQHAPAAASQSRRQGRNLQRRWRRPGARLGHDLRRRAGLADFFPLRGGDHQAGRIRHERARRPSKTPSSAKSPTA